MDDKIFRTHFDSDTCTLELSGVIDRASLPLILDAVERAFRRTACRLTVDLTRAQGLPPHILGQLVHLCNTGYPGTFVRPPSYDHLRAIA
jgi:hypothetical protein